MHLTTTSDETALALYQCVSDLECISEILDETTCDAAMPNDAQLLLADASDALTHAVRTLAHAARLIEEAEPMTQRWNPQPARRPREAA